MTTTDDTCTEKQQQQQNNDDDDNADDVATRRRITPLSMKHSHFMPQKRFSLLLSTEDINKISHHHPKQQLQKEQQQQKQHQQQVEDKEEEVLFYGSFVDIRKTLNYNYHSYYTKERQFLQDIIIQSIVFGNNGNDNDTDYDNNNDNKNHHNSNKNSEQQQQQQQQSCCWILFVVGPYYSGKSYTINKLIYGDGDDDKEEDQQYLPFSEESYVKINKNDIRRHLPEFDTYVMKLQQKQQQSKSQQSVSQNKQSQSQPTTTEEEEEMEGQQQTITKETNEQSSSSSCYEKILQLTNKETDYIIEISIRLAIKYNKHIIIDISTIHDLQSLFTNSSDTRSSNNNDDENNENEKNNDKEESSLSSYTTTNDNILKLILNSNKKNDEHHNKYKIGLLHITTSYEHIIQNAAKHSLDMNYDGLVIPEHIIKEQYQQIPQYVITNIATQTLLLSEEEKEESSEQQQSSVNNITTNTNAGIIDFFCEIFVDKNNELSIIKPHGMDWKSFQKNFITTTTKSASSTTPTTTLLTSSTGVLYDKRKSHHRASQQESHHHEYRYRKFSFYKTTEENYKSTKNEQLIFVGPYESIRKSLDYTYHENYTIERQRLQDVIINDFLNTTVITDKNHNNIICTTPTDPFIVFTAGAMGAGKSWVMNKLVEKGRFPLLAFVLVDPDEVRRHFPEFHIYVKTNPLLAGELTRKEAGYVCEILTLAALQQGKNVLVDGSLRDYQWYTKYFVELRHQFPNLRLAIIHITAPRDDVFKRAATRAQKTGRVVPEKTLIDAIEKVPKSVDILKDEVDYFAELNNSSSNSTAAPGDNIELIKGGKDWDDFESHWQQTCKFIPGRRNFLRTSKQANAKLAIGGRQMV